jgi:hypothetical protein
MWKEDLMASRSFSKNMKIATRPLFCTEPPGMGIFLKSVALLTKKRNSGAQIRQETPVYLQEDCLFV